MHQLNTPTIWLVDDDEDDQHLVRSAFLDCQPSITIVVLDDGEELLPKLIEADTLPQLILLDVNMPRKNGFDTLEQLRSIADYAHLPVVMLTTSSSEQDRQRSLALGANHFLTKPLTYQQLRQLAQEISHQWMLT